MTQPMPIAGSAVTMAILADKVSRGGRLTDTELNIVMTNTAEIYASSFGPKPAEMRLSPVQLPENVKGVLATFSL